MKILLNCLPPADINTPSISLSILKAFMLKNRIETNIKYWNFLWPNMEDYFETEDSEIRLIPFLSILNDIENNNKGNRRILSLLQKIQPSFKDDNPNYYDEYLEEIKSNIYEILDSELENIDFSEISLFGITAKYNQWIPGMILAEEVKKIAPNTKIIVGGFGSKAVAMEAMKFCPYFDFANWGEGEYPLLSLMDQINSKDSCFDSVPRLIYRKKHNLTVSSTQKSKYLDFEHYIYPNFEDFVVNHPNIEDNDKINIPINTIRSCSWSKCKFCDFNKGYKLRARSPECIVDEIESLTKQYGFTTYSFVDSDTFINVNHFEKLLDLIINLKYVNEKDYIFWAEIIPNDQFNARIMEKMAIAGFKNIFIGYDALSDSLLRKMNKSNSFSDNIFFVKYAIKNGISPFVNVIKHTPDETEEDIQECINNLHFLRFFYNDNIISFSHQFVDLVLSSMSKYYSILSEESRNKYYLDELSYLMPNKFSNNKERFHLFRYRNSSPNNIREWNNLMEVEEYYKTNNFSYKIQENNDVFYYTEYRNDEEIADMVFGEPEYALILKAIEGEIYSFLKLKNKLKENDFEISDARIKEVLFNLKSLYLIYYNNNFLNIVSVIHV